MGKYYGVVRNSSPTYVRATFSTRAEAQAYIDKQPDSDAYRVITY